MTLSATTARRLAAARDISAVLVFCALVFTGGRALVNSPHLQKERLTQKETAADISEFFAKVEKTHPGPFTGLTAQQYAVLKSSALAQAEARLDELGRLQVPHLAYILYGSAAQFGDGSTQVLWQPRRKWKDPELKFPPFRVEYIYGRFTVGSTLDPSMAGAELLAVNGLPFSEFIKPALGMIAGETAAHRQYVFCRDQDFWWDFSGLLAARPLALVKYRTPAGLLRSKEVELVTAGGFRRFAGAPYQPKTMTYSQKKLAWLNVGPLPWSRSGRKTYDRFFRELREQGIEDLVLDLRDSSSGDPRIADYLLSNLSGSFGRITVLIGPGTAGAGAVLAARLKEFKAGELLGEETGGAPDHFGAPEEFKLGSSGIRYTVATEQYAFPGGQARVSPDLRLTEDLLRPHKGDLKAFVLERLARARKAGKT